MCDRVGSQLKIFIISLVAILVSHHSALAIMLQAWQFDDKANQLEFILDSVATPKYFTLSQPPRIVIDLPNTDLGKVVTKQDYQGIVRQIRVSRFQEGIARIVLELDPNLSISKDQVNLQQLANDQQQYRWRLTMQLGKPTISSSQPSYPPVSVSVTEFPPAIFSGSGSGVTIQVPPLPGNVTNSSPNTSVIEFGQPLPSKE